MTDITYGRWNPDEVRERVLDGTWVAETQYISVEYFLVGGGGGGQGDRGGGGGGGYTTTGTTVLLPGSQVDVEVGIGGALGTGGFGISNPGGTGGTTLFSDGSVNYVANGGQGGGVTGSKDGGDGGSGGASGNGSNTAYSLIGGSDGSDGQSTIGTNGTGQGTTTRAFGEPAGTLYAGGGGGGSYDSGSTRTGGAGGGGNGGSRLASQNATAGSPNTGGGGGGGMEQGNGAAGGSGVILLRFPDTFNVTPGAGVTASSSANGGFRTVTITDAPAGSTITFAEVPPPPAIITSGLILHLDAGQASSYSGSGTSWNDLSDNNNDATLIDGPTYESANGGAILFDGSNDYASVASSNDFAFGTGDFTLEVWIYPQSFSNYTHMFALPSQSTFALKANVTDGAVYFYSPSYDTYGSTSGWTLSLNQWNHVIFKRENSVGYAFLNSIEKGSKSGFTNSFSAQTLNIHNGYPNEFTACKMSVIRIYDRALSSSEITQNFNALRDRYGI